MHGPAAGSAEIADFDAVYRAHAPAVTGYLKAHGVDDPEAVTQDVFLAVLSRAGTIKGGDDGMRTLIFSIAHARCVDHHRRAARMPMHIAYEPDRDHRTEESAETVVVQTIARSDIRSVLSSLGEDQRDALLLRLIGDLPLNQVAEIMHKSVGSIKQLQHRALVALRNHPDVQQWGQA